MNEIAESRQDIKRTRWRKYNEAWQQSGLSQQNYCQENGIALATFGYWRRKLKSKQPEKPRFYPLIVPTEEPAVREDPQTALLRLVLGKQRFIIEIGDSFSPAVMQKLVSELERL